MVRLDLARTANTNLFSNHPLVAVFVGGTSGIGEYTLRSLADLASTQNQGTGLRVYLVGRNATAADTILDDCRKKCPQGRFFFVKASNIAELSDVDKCCAEIKRLEEQTSEGSGPARVDLLAMSQAVLQFGPRNETKEGIDTSMSLLYYSRMRFITQLLPMLRASMLPTGARCISIYAGGFEDKKKFFPDDFDLRKPDNFSFNKVRSQVTYMKTLFFERLAQQNEGKIGCVHIYPGLVMTPAMNAKSNPWWFRAAMFCSSPVLRLYATSPEDIGQRMLYLATDRYPAQDLGERSRESFVAEGSTGQRGSGAYSVNVDGHANDISKAYADFDKRTMTDKVWKHTMEVFESRERSAQGLE